MAFVISDRVINQKLARQLAKSREENADSLEKLSTGQVFTTHSPSPSERALADGLEFKLRGFAASKRNLNDGISLLQTADSGLSEVNNMLVRMKELNTAASNTTLTDRERRYLFVEYEALRDEIDRVAKTTEFNGLPILDGSSPDAPESLVFHISDPQVFEGYEDEELNVIKFNNFRDIVATADGLGIKSARSLLLDSENDGGISVQDAADLMVADDEEFSSSYEQALTKLATQRAIFGAMQTRMLKAMDFYDVYAENIAAAKSKIADTDYASEVAKMAASNVLISATTALMGQTNIQGQLALNLISSVLR